MLIQGDQKRLSIINWLLPRLESLRYTQSLQCPWWPLPRKGNTLLMTQRNDRTLTLLHLTHCVILHIALYMLHFTHSTLHFPLYMFQHIPLYTLHLKLWTLHVALYTLNFASCTLHMALYTLYIHCTLQIALYTSHFAHYILHIALYTLHILLYPITKGLFLQTKNKATHKHTDKQSYIVTS